MVTWAPDAKKDYSMLNTKGVGSAYPVQTSGSCRSSGSTNGSKLVDGIDLTSDYANGRGGKGWEVPGCGPDGESVLKGLYA